MLRAFRFELLHAGRRLARARWRASRRRTAPVDTPAFMPVGTQGTVKGVDPGRLRETGAQMILANTYHLALRPGRADGRGAGRPARASWAGTARSSPTAAAFRSSAWPNERRSTSSGVAFRSHIDGALGRADAGAGRRHPGAARQRRGHGARPRRGAAERARRRGRRDAAERPLGRALPRGGDARRPGAVRHRARRARRRAARRVGRAARGAGLSPATRSAD